MPTVGPSLPERKPPGFIGSLADTPLAEVFRRIVSEERSGDLQVTTPEAIKTVYFDRGFVVFASSDRKRDRLGESMIESGRISTHDFAAASELMKASRVKFGKALVSSGIVSEEELGHYVAAQVNRIVLSLFPAKRGMYSFDERPTGIPMDLRVSLSVYRILMEGIRHMTIKKLVLAGLPSLDTDVKVVDRPPFALDLTALRPVERSVLKAVSDRAADIRVVIDSVGGEEGVVLRAVYGLLAAGVLEAKSEQPRGPVSVQFETGTFVLSEISHSVSAPEEKPASAPKPAPRMPAPARAPTPIARTPVVQEPALATTAAPDDEASTGIVAVLKTLWAALLSFLGLSSETPSDRSIVPIPAARRPRPETPRVATLKAAPPPPVESAAVPVPVPEPPPPAPIERVGVPSWSVQDAPEEVPPRVPEIQRSSSPEWSVADNPADQFRDFFEEQGVPLGSSKKDQEAPARRSHSRERPPSVSYGVPSNEKNALSVSDPDLPGELPEDDAPSMFVQIPIEEVAVRSEDVRIELPDEVEIEVVEVESDLEPQVAEAVEKIQSEPEPMRPASPTPAVSHARTAADSTATPSEEKEPASLAQAHARRRAQAGGESRLLRDVKLHFKLRDWEGAVPLLEQLIEISPGKALYRGMLGRALSRHPSRRKEAETQFVEALRLSPHDPEIHYWLGLYYKSFGLGSRALNEFRTTLRIDPRHEGARKQLGASGKQDDALGSVIKKIFG